MTAAQPQGITVVSAASASPGLVMMMRDIGVLVRWPSEPGDHRAAVADNPVGGDIPESNPTVLFTAS